MGQSISELSVELDKYLQRNEASSEDISNEDEWDDEDDLVYADLDEFDGSENSKQGEEHSDVSEN